MPSNMNLSRFRSVCRICTGSDDKMISLLTVDKDLIEYNIKLYSCVPSINIDNPNFPSEICQTCVMELHRAFNFRQMCLESTRTFIQFFDKMKRNSEIEVSIEEEPQDLYENDTEMMGNDTDYPLGSEICFDAYINDHNYFKRPEESPKNIILLNKTPIDLDKIPTETKIKHENIVKNAIKPVIPLSENKYDSYNSKTKIVKESDGSNNSDEDNSLKICLDNPNCGNKVVVNPLLDDAPNDKEIELPYICTECDTGFSSTDELANHLKLHIKIKNMKCGTCLRCFTQEEFCLHICEHSKPHLTCPHCLKKFQNSWGLSKHKIKCHADEFCVCKLCNKFFASPKSLRKHMKRHTINLEKGLPP